MNHFVMVVSDPPHGELDPKRAAPEFGLTAAEARMKANYPAPEIWLACTDGAEMEATAATMSEAGLRVAVVDSTDLAAVPDRGPVRAFSLEHHRLRLTLDTGDDVSLGPDDAVVCLGSHPYYDDVGRPSRASADAMTEGLRHHRTSLFGARDSVIGFGLGSRSLSDSSDVDMVELPWYVDLFASRDGHVERSTLIVDQVDFSGMGDLATTNVATNFTMFLTECGERFPSWKTDQRLVNLHLHQRPLVRVRRTQDAGVPYINQGLPQFLADLSPDLARADPLDLMARLAYVTTVQRQTE